MIDNDDMPRIPMPWWVKLLIIADALPVVALPALLSRCQADSPAETFVMFYPLYVLAASVCEWIVWRRRPDVCYILLAVVLLTHIGIWALVLE